jgi:hypothetical protein
MGRAAGGPWEVESEKGLTPENPVRIYQSMMPILIGQIDGTPRD